MSCRKYWCHVPYMFYVFENTLYFAAAWFVFYQFSLKLFLIWSLRIHPSRDVFSIIKAAFQSFCTIFFQTMSPSLTKTNKAAAKLGASKPVGRSEKRVPVDRPGESVDPWEWSVPWSSSKQEPNCCWFRYFVGRGWYVGAVSTLRVSDTFFKPQVRSLDTAGGPFPTVS